MPQINRIRVNNVKYNFGTQYYDDFMMRFNCKNTIYDLANGGGKSLLMLLLMQNMIPNCTLDEKQPIEKLFRKGSGNTCIHSLVEWKLDSCYVEDGFKYMTTGFCARKGRGNDDAESDSEEELQSGAGSETASVDYFNYCIFYREFGDNDIKNLPLASNGERITYNGLKTYLRDLEKGEYRYIVKIFDRKGDYQSFISNYGIYESAWEIVRGINKTEGHVRTYFETNYRTSRKVIEDLLIEEIIQKSFNNRLSVENDEGKMAKTLLDIKDKLIELSKKHSQMGAYDSQIAAIESFRDYLKEYGNFYQHKEQLENELYELLVAAIAACGRKEKDTLESEKKAEELKARLDSEMETIAVAEIMSEKKSLSALGVYLKETEKNKTAKEKEISEIGHRLSLMEAANEYKDYSEYEKTAGEITIALENASRGDEDITGELKKLATRYRYLLDKEIKSLKEKQSLAEDNIEKLKGKIEETRFQVRNADKEAAGAESLKERLLDETAELEEKLKMQLANAELMVAENSETERRRCDAELKQIVAELDAKEKEYAGTRESVFAEKEKEKAATALIDILSGQRDALKEKNQHRDENRKKLEDIRSIYSAADDNERLNIILDTYRRMNREYEEAVSQAEELRTFAENAKNGTYICKDPARDRLKEYLLSQYGDDVVEGHEWFRNLSTGEKRDVLKRTPFVEYGFIIKNDFERIKEDAALQEFGRGACTYPVISEQVLYDTKLEINKDLIVFALKDMSFLRDESRLETEIKKAEEEYDALIVNIEKLNDRKTLVWEDYAYMLEYLAVFKSADITDTIADLEERIEAEGKNRILAQEAALSFEKKAGELQVTIAGLNERKNALDSRITAIKEVSSVSSKLAEEYEQIRAIDAGLKEISGRLELCENDAKRLDAELSNAENLEAGIADRMKELNRNWELEYSAYYDENASIQDDDDEIYSLDIEEIESKFIGLKTAITGKNSDTADKEALLNHLKLSMGKCKEDIEYRGFALEEIKDLIGEGKVSPTDTAALRKVKDEQKNAENELSGILDEFNAQSALFNRLEGSIAHGVNQIETKYGEYREFECDNPETFGEQHKDLVKSLEAEIKTQNGESKRLSNELKELQVCRKDLERIVTEAGMEIPEMVREEELVNNQHKIEDFNRFQKEYSAIQKDYAGLNRLEYKKIDEFAGKKQGLIDLLTGFNAIELADEIRISLNLPENVARVQDMMKSLDETNTFIALEKDRVAKGIEDMERIKDNFENRCIQTCSNIKTELDRLPQLSGINLDGEQISIISLAIPYVKEEMYKENMSAYIDETITMAESFSDTEERLKYIRNRLTWKRLFSVIVTDMNSIRINLYKRERIKDQSRYLRYEEAVGSTGQSQGIYIQFLIAIINYISNMNCRNNDGGVEGKTIFIDNPFGAAKDIYIWEPIFKMLATNHVQLVVPARGATPAITGRFDVNYILGQKLAGKRQQTVVVDYYSNTKEAELEYTRMDYEQATFDFL